MVTKSDVPHLESLDFGFNMVVIPYERSLNFPNMYRFSKHDISGIECLSLLLPDLFLKSKS